MSAWSCPSEFLEKLAAIVPPPRAHLVKWSGVVARNSPHLRKVILKPGVKKVSCHKQCAEIKAGEAGFRVDVGRCQCGGELRVMAAICKPDEARCCLRYAGLPPDLTPDLATQAADPSWD